MCVKNSQSGINIDNKSQFSNRKRIEKRNKYKEINVSNYRGLVRDFIGVRILVFAQEEWENIFDSLMDIFSCEDRADMHIAEKPIAYTRYGDRDIFGGKIYTEHSNKGYRSRHYIVWVKSCYVEIQVRILAEEVYGEFDHTVKYPYREQNNFLRRYTGTMVQLFGSVDELISTCMQMKENGWDECDKYFEEDRYIDWIAVAKKVSEEKEETEIKTEWIDNGKINMLQFANDSILRKG